MYLVLTTTQTVTGGGGAMGLEVAKSVLETGGDVICVDRAPTILTQEWGKL